MGRAAIILTGKAAREKAISWIIGAPTGTYVEFKRSQRTDPQNRRMWALLTAVSDQLVWHGAKYHPEDWKDFFMPHEEGGMIPIGRRTSKLTKDEHSDLTTIIEAFAARNGVNLAYEKEDA